MKFERNVRLLIAALFVSVPTAYLLWQWSHEPEPELKGLSYESFHAKLSNAEDPSFWTYAIYLSLLYVSMLTLTRVLAWGLELVFPDRKGEG